jgi:hypothetical protein
MPLPILDSSAPTSYRHPFWCCSLRRTDIVSIITTIILCPIGGATIITIILHPIGRIIGVSGGYGWGRGVYSRRWSSFSVGGDLLAHLLFIIRVIEDDDIVVIRRPKEPTVNVDKESLGELLIS